MNFEEEYGHLLEGLDEEHIRVVQQTLAASYHEGRAITQEKVALLVQYVKKEINKSEYVSRGLELELGK
ncbi:MAG: hypothetical protein J6M18_01395 [Actinomycetaceae bacterium]|nr:hypothetical protein [Actinomycetaceae bacterium]